MSKIPQTAIDCYQEGVALLAQNRVSEALSEIRRAVAADPQFNDARFQLGKLYRKLGRYDEALEVLTTCVEDLADDQEVVVEYAEVALFTGATPFSLRVLGHFIKRFPSATDIAEFFIILLAVSAGYRKTYRNLKRLLRKNPTWTQGYYWQGVCLEQMGKVQKATQAYARGLEKDPNNPLLAREHQRIKEGTPHKKNPFQKAFAKFFVREAERLFEEGFSSRSIIYLEQWWQSAPKNRDLLMVLLKAYLRVSQYRRAMSVIRSLAKDQRSFDINQCEAMLHEKLENWDEAATAYRNCCQEEPTHLPAWLGLSQALSGSGKHHEAWQTLREAAALFSDNAELWFQRARLAYLISDYQDSLLSLQESHRLDPDNPAVLLALGVELLRAEKPAEALTYLNQLAQNNPQHVEARRNLALAETLLHHWEKAAEWWRAVLALVPSDEQARTNLVRLEPYLGPSEEPQSGSSGEGADDR